MDRRATRRARYERAHFDARRGGGLSNDCGGPMYRIRAQNVRKDGSKQYNVYSGVGAATRAPPSAGICIPLEELDAWVEAYKMSILRSRPGMKSWSRPATGMRTRSSRSSKTYVNSTWTIRLRRGMPRSQRADTAAVAPGHPRQGRAPQDRGHDRAVVGHAEGGRGQARVPDQARHGHPRSVARESLTRAVRGLPLQRCSGCNWRLPLPVLVEQDAAPAVTPIASPVSA